MKNKIISTSTEETNNIANIISKELNNEIYVLLTGDLGSGKTTFTKHLIKALGAKENVASPTFNILNQYQIDNKVINHMDAYRLNKNSDLEMFLEEFENNINIIEWWTNIELDLINKNIIQITINKLNETSREFIIERN